MRTRAKIGIGLATCLGTAGLAVLGLIAADRAFPPPLDAARVVSREVQDADGELLRAFATPEGRWRLKTTVADVDPQFLKMLIAYEDRRFYEHKGIDPLAFGRAFVQLITHGRIVSGGSTLTMQVARLIEPRTERSVPAKLLQMFRAFQIERRLNKTEILNLYLTHAPYGGNLEGVRAASLAYFGRTPARLDVAQAALLVALPQLPEKRRPDRNEQAAAKVRERVLKRTAVAAVVGEGEVERASLQPVPTTRRQLPAYAAHLAELAVRKEPALTLHKTTLKREIQAGLEFAAASAAQRLGPKVSVAIVMADLRTGAIVGEVGSAGYFESARAGWVDMTRVLRSPGSTLKPFIYGLAFEQGYVAQQTIIEDRPADFFGYRPRNFDMSYQGDVSVREALQLSLNVPAVRLLDAVGPTRLLVRFRRAGVKPVLPPNEAPGLAIALGGIGVTLKDLVQLYTGLASRGQLVQIGDGVSDQPERLEGEPLMEPVAAWNITDILSDVLAPRGSRQLGIAYKTGTSYGNRDAWSIGYDGAHVVGVWVGRPDNGAVPGLTGYLSAAPVLFDAFVKSGVAIAPFPTAPQGARHIAAADLPMSQKRFSMTSAGLLAMSGREPAPQIVYPPEGARVDLGVNDAAAQPEALSLKLQGGRAPFHWLANGKPLPELSRRRTLQWVPEGAGYSTLTVIDAAGRAASVRVFVE